MSEDWAAIAGEVGAGLSEAGFTAMLIKAGTQTGPAYNPTFGAPSTHTITVVDTRERVRDQNGTLVGQTMRTLLVSAADGVVPSKNDKIAIDGKDHEISEVRPLAPGGVNVLYKVDLEI